MVAPSGRKDILKCEGGKKTIILIFGLTSPGQDVCVHARVCACVWRGGHSKVWH